MAAPRDEQPSIEQQSTDPQTDPTQHRIEHDSGYGGKRGEPRVSSDQREEIVSDDGTVAHEKPAERAKND
jgi:hypothetical protein